MGACPPASYPCGRIFLNGLSVGAIESQGRVLEALLPLNMGAIKGLKCLFLGL